MSVITYDHISVSGVSFLRLLSMDIEQKINEHSRATICCEMTKEQAAEADSMPKYSYIIVSYSVDEDSGVLFYGVKISSEIQIEGEYYVVRLELASTSYILDKEPVKKSYSNSQKTIEDIMQEVVGNQAIIDFHVTDRVLAEFTMQYNETKWAFIKRLASRCNASVIANITTKKPVIHIGKPEEEVEENESFESRITETFNMDIPIIQETKCSTSYNSFTDFSTWGGTININDGIVSKTTIKMNDTDFMQDRFSNKEVEGLILSGIVQEIDKNKVKVFFDEIDSEYDASTDTWFEYSTAYASNGGGYGSGFFFMPEEGDRVKVFFPTKSESEGVVIGSVQVSPLDDITKMKWRAPGGQELLFTKDGIKISGSENSVFIEMSQREDSEYGLQIICDKDISVVSQAGQDGETSDIIVAATDKLIMYADKQIKLETDSASLEINRNDINFCAENSYLLNDD